MQKLVKLMVDYKLYHTHTWNTYSHFVGVPLVTFALFLFLAWFRFIVPEFGISVATIFFLCAMLHYFRLSARVAFYVLAVFGPILLLAEYCARLSFSTSLQVFLYTFVLGWVFQLIGHYFEGRRPALVDNIFQVFNAPVFIVCEALFMTGRMTNLKNKLDMEFAKAKHAEETSKFAQQRV